MSPRRAVLRLALALGISLVLACGSDDDGSALDGGELDAGSLCSNHADCEDVLFCNGAERCEPGAISADARGCIAGDAPCPGACTEGERCSGECPDADRDGARDEACGGNDCDDSDPARYPGNTEICDAEGRDEDCDPSTLGHDRDGDGYVDAACCNLQPSGPPRCGNDCDDTSSDVRPGILDACGNGDEDCDGAVDEDPNRTYYRDRDGDGFGTSEDTIQACAPTGAYVAVTGDCDDTDRRRSPVADEICDTAELDEDCDGLRNEGCSCVTGTTRPCGIDVGACEPGVQTCLVDGDGASIWGEVCSGAVGPTVELCNLVDEDCDGDLRGTFQCLPDEVETGVNACGRTGTRACLSASCTWATSDFAVPETAATCDYCDDTGTAPLTGEAFATRTHTFTFEGTAPLALGNAAPSDGYTALVTHSSASPRAGAVFDPTAVPLGWGGAVLDAAMRSIVPGGATLPPGDGWALIAIVGGGAPTLGPGGAALGVPRDRDGFAVEWRRYQEDAPATATDSLVIRRLSASGADPVVVRVPNPMPAGPTAPVPGQRVELEVRPDVPGTPEDETMVRVRFRASGVWSSYHGCGPSFASACGLVLAPGTPMRFGISAAVSATRQESFFFRSALDPDQGAPIPELRVSGLCP